uniref:MULE transposase domain-containing protein n=1 Tax=Lactuca sativa TaxID=4236 RepID=A0A9R1VY45_LACSA|nr:hypothetical protein LSAT_V11C400213590 [Lactuca sativa]
MTKLEQQNLFEFGEVPNFDDRLSHEKSIEGWSEDDLGPNDKIFVSQTYNTKKELTSFVKFKAVKEMFQIKIRDFIGFCRKVVIMDDAHLNGKYNGTILHVVAMDENNIILPIRNEVYPKKTTDSWTWFLEKLHECIGDLEGLTLVTDRAALIFISIQKKFQMLNMDCVVFL